MALGGHAAQAQAQDGGQRPNILWIVSEDNTAEFLGCYGNAYATTPNIDRLASEGILYTHAFSSAPVSAPSRCTLITGMYPTTLGTENMRSTYPVPGFVRFFPKYLREAGYYTTNNSKKDYNTTDQEDAWDESSPQATYKNRRQGQPFFAVFNLMTTHEMSIFARSVVADMRRRMGRPAADDDTPQGPEYPVLQHHPDSVLIPPYLPDIPEMRHDFALYYDRHQQMDRQVGALLRELDEAGLADNTIVFYYGDNGGVLGRSKRYVFESGLHVPLVVRIPEKFRHLASRELHGRDDRLVSFVDFAPTVLSLAGIQPPAYHQGRPFLGRYEAPAADAVFNFRGRMDEAVDLVRSLRTPRYRYVRNYYPHRPYGQHINFLWLARSIQAWEREYRAGHLSELQSRFFQAKPAEELYDVEADPHNTRNLAADPQYQDVLRQLRTRLHQQLLDQTDAGFLPEAEVEELSGHTTPYDYVRSPGFRFADVLHAAETASLNDARQQPWLARQLLESPNPAVRYWAATGLLILGQAARPSAGALRQALQTDAKPYVRIAAAEALYQLGHTAEALGIVRQYLHHPNRQLALQAVSVLQSVSPADLALFSSELRALASGRGEYTTNVAAHLLSKIGEGR